MADCINPAPELPQFKFDGVYLRPVTDDYNPGYVSSGVFTNLGGGPVRVRAQHANGAIVIDCSYSFNASQYKFFRDWYDATLFHGVKRFVGVFEVTGQDLAENNMYVAQFVPGSVQDATYKSGYYYVVNCRVSLVPHFDRCLQTSRALWREAFGSGCFYDEFVTITDPLERLL